MIYDFCLRYNVKGKRCGKLIVANNDFELRDLDQIHNQAIRNGLEDVRMLSQDEAKEIEPYVKCSKALWIPSSGIMDTHGIMAKLENICIQNDVSFAYKCSVNDIVMRNGHYQIYFKDDNTVVKSKVVINAAGLWSHKISRLLNIEYDIQ